MSAKWNIEALLERELRRTEPPPDLWARIEAKLDKPEKSTWKLSFSRPAWAFAAFGVGVAVFAAVAYLWPTDRAPVADLSFDLGPYLTPVQSASDAATSRPAIYNAPPEFIPYGSEAVSVAPAGYRIEVERSASLKGQAVHQYVFANEDRTVSLFVGSPHVRFDAKNENWVDATLGKIRCKKIDCPRMRTVQFACGIGTCVLVCKACTEGVMQSLVAQISANFEENLEPVLLR